MERWWRTLGFQLGRQWKAVLAAVLVITAVLAVVGLPRLEFATGEESYLDRDSQVAIDNAAFQQAFGGESIVLLFIADDDTDIIELVSMERGNGERSNLEELEHVAEQLRGIEEVHAVADPLTTLRLSHALLEVAPGVDLPTSSIAGNSLLDALANREESGSPEQLARVRDGATSIARFRCAIEERRALGDESGEERLRLGDPEYTEFVIFDNAAYGVDQEIDDLGDALATQCDNLMRGADSDRRVRSALRGVFPSFDGGVPRHAVGAVVLTGNASLDEMSAGTDAVMAVLETAEFDGFELVAAGSPPILKDINDYLQGGMLTLGGAALVVMAVVLAVMFRVRWRLLPLVACVIGILWSFSLFGIIGLPLSLVTISGLPILIGLGIDFAIQIHNRVEEEVTLDHAEHPIQRTLANVAPALVVATIAAVVAFISLQVSLVPMIRDFGVLLAIGVVVMLIVGIVITTATLGVREHTHPTGDRKVSVVERITVKLGSLPTRFGLGLIVAAVLIFGVGVVVESGIKVESDPLNWLDQSNSSVQDVRRLEDETGISSTMGVFVQANNVADQDVIDVLDAFITSAEAREEVVGATSLVATMSKLIEVDGATRLPPTSDDLIRGASVAPPDLQRLLFEFADGDDGSTAVPERTVAEPAGREFALPGVIEGTQVSLRLGPMSLEERGILVNELQEELDGLIAGADVDAGTSILWTGIDPERDTAMRATPSGLAVVGTALLDNVSANRAALTYIALVAVALWLLIRLRSLPRMFFTLVPVGIAVGLSAIVVGGTGITMSPMTVVSGPLVIATCAEFCVLITARYLEERQRGYDPDTAGDRAAGRTGRAFFTSAATTIGGFAVLIGSALPLLRDFGIIVTLNVAIALLAALVVMPPLVKWADTRRWLATREAPGAVVLAAPAKRKVLVWAGGALAVLVAAFAVTLATLDSGTGAATEAPYTPIALPAVVADEEETGDSPESAIDPSGFADELPPELAGTTIGPILFERLTDRDIPPNVAVCAASALFLTVPDVDDRVADFAADWTREGLAPVVDAATACGVSDEVIDDIIAAGPGG